MYKKSPKVTYLWVILLEVKLISRLRQSISLKVNQTISSLLKYLLHDERSKSHGFELACPLGILILVIDQDKVAFILTLDSFLVSLVGQGCITMFLIELLEI
jgi:hypothetical protein